jgi:short-subunit dehydrogenase
MAQTTREGAGRTALVTGASAGIGVALAEVLAERGFDLILTARREDRLHALAGRLASAHGIAVHVVPCDLADPAAPARLVGEIAARGLQVDVLVNNAGYGVPGRYEDSTWAQQAEFLQVLVTAVAELTHRVLPGMIARRWGRVLNVASLAAHVPAAAGHTLYAAAKAFVLKFSEALAAETAGQGVLVTASCPGFTYSEFHDVVGTREQVSTMPRVLWQDARSVAEESYAALMAGRPVVLTDTVNRLVARAVRFAPDWLSRAVVARMGRRYRKL